MDELTELASTLPKPHDDGDSGIDAPEDPLRHRRKVKDIQPWQRYNEDGELIDTTEHPAFQARVALNSGDQAPGE